MQRGTQRVAIIGAGLAGLTCADALRETHDVTVFEKSRGIGGRLSTRRAMVGDETVRFDHGAPVLNGLSPDMRERLEDAGSVVEWDRAPSLDEPALVGTPQMNRTAAPLAEGLDIRFQARVGRIADGVLHMEPHEREGGTATGEEGPFDRIVLAIPPAQAAALLVAPEPAMTQTLAAIPMVPCWTLMIAFEHAPDDGIEGLHDPDGEVIWLVREASKAGRVTFPDRWVMQMSPSWSRAHLDLDREDVLRELKRVFASHVRDDEPLFAAAHRWKHAYASEPLGHPCLANADETLLVGGDWCLGPHAGHAVESGLAMAERIRDVSG